MTSGSGLDWDSGTTFNDVEGVSIGDGELENCYGGLKVREDGGKFLWALENYTDKEWHEIPRYLYVALRKYEQERQKK